jgi:hypothetical protein
MIAHKPQPLSRGGIVYGGAMFNSVEEPMRILFIVVLGALIAGCATPSGAGGLVDVTLIDQTTGERLQSWRRGGKLYVAGTPGNRYAVELRNRTGARVLAVLSVDGVNAITGQTASEQQSGYVLDGWQHARIGGWRKSMDDVAAFYFTSVPDSYAARTGRPANVGVIGVALYREAVEPVREPDAPAGIANEGASAPAPRDSAGKAESAEREDRSAQALGKRLGTGHGERVHAPTRYTEFRRASDRPEQTIVIHYDSHANLMARGIIPRPRPADPRPFPGGFAPDPWG